MYNYPLFASKQTFARIDFLRYGERLVDKKATFCVKFITKNRQNDCSADICMGNDTENS